MEAEFYEPSAWGAEFHSLPHDEALGAGSAGPGKSLVLLMDPLEQIYTEHERCTNSNHPHHIPWGSSTGKALHLRRELPTLTETINRSRRIFPQIDPKAVFKQQDKTWIFSSGYQYQFDHCANPGDWSRYQSLEYTWIGFDEVNQFTEEQYENIGSRLRSTDPVLGPTYDEETGEKLTRGMLKIRCMCNPVPCPDQAAKDPNWVRARFVDPNRKGRETFVRRLVRKDGSEDDVTRIYLPATLYDNPDPNFVRQYELNLLSRPPHIRNALLYGDWYITAGSFYGEDWIERLHVCRPFKIPHDWPVFRAMDWGFKTNGCVLWFAMDYDENLYCFREFSFKLMPARQVAERIREIEKDMGLWGRGESLITGAADTQLWEERGESGQSKAEEMAERGVNWIRADKKSRARNAERVLARLKDHGHETHTPGLVFFDTCRMCTQTIPSIQPDDKDPEAPAKGGNDHWHDAVCYGVAFASRGMGAIPMREEDDYYDEGPAQQRTGRYGYGGV